MDNQITFSLQVKNLESLLYSVRTVWRDEIAATYECLNDNIVKCCDKIHGHCESSVTAFNAVKNNYDSSEVENVISSLGQEISSV